jgi:heme exporter protein B
MTERSSQLLGTTRAAMAIAAKDLRVEWRQKSGLLSAMAFAVLALTLFFFAWDSTAIASIDIAPGVLWVIFTFAGLLGLHRSFGVEQPTRAMDALLAAPIEREAIFLGKAIANLVLVALVQLVTVPAMTILYNVPIGSVIGPLAAVIFLAAVGIVTIGTLFSSMAVNTRLAELLLPLLALPFFVPIVIAAKQRGICGCWLCMTWWQWCSAHWCTLL